MKFNYIQTKLTYQYLSQTQSVIQCEQINVATCKNTDLENSQKQISDIQKIAESNRDDTEPNQLNTLSLSSIDNQENTSPKCFDISLTENKMIDNLKNNPTEANKVQPDLFHHNKQEIKDQKIITQLIQESTINSTPDAKIEEILSSHEKKIVKLNDVNIIKGFPNFDMNCFLNCSLQVIRQMNYYENNKLLQMSSFGKLLAQIFNYMDQEELIKYTLQQLMKDLGNSQKIEKGGDCYQTLLILLSKLKDKKNSSTSQINKYNDFFKLNYEDGIICSQCQQYIKNEKYYNYENKIGCEVNNLDQVFESEIKYPIESVDYCCYRQKGKLIPQKKFINSPQYIIVRLLKQQLISYRNQLSKIYKNNDNSYQIIGFVKHYSFHYTYTARYNDKWIEFDDNRIQKQIPNQQCALIYILKKL